MRASAARSGEARFGVQGFGQRVKWFWMKLDSDENGF